MINNYKILLLILIGLFVLFPTVEIFAACTSGPFAGDPPCCLVPGACNPGCPDCTPTPLDGGLSALLIAGFAFGAKKIRGKKA